MNDRIVGDLSGNMNDRLLEDFYKVLYRMHKCLPNFKKHGELSNVEFFILIEISMLIDECGHGITLGDVIRSTDMTMSAASKKISILEKKGLVKRQVSERDRRRIDITLTPEGEALCEEEKLKKQEWMLAIISGMGENDSRELFRLFNKMLDVIEDIDCTDGKGV